MQRSARIEQPGAHLMEPRETAEQYASTPSGIDAHRLAGDNAFWSGDFKTAIAEYRRYLAKHKSGMLADAARRSLAYALESDQQYPDAAKEYDALVGRFDRGSSGEFLLGAARSYRAAQQPNEAIARLERLDVEYGETAAAQMGRIELAELRALTGTATSPAAPSR
jgi:TolA-binding protein